MKAHMGVDAHSGLVHALEGTAAKVNDVAESHKLLHADSGCQSSEKRPGRAGKWSCDGARRCPIHPVGSC